MWRVVEGYINKFSVNEIGKVCRGMKKVYKCKSRGKNVKKRPCEAILVSTALLGGAT